MGAETKSLGRKDILDRFYTKESIVQLCLKELDLSQYEMIIEPSAGNGAFSSNIPNCLSYDISPANNQVM